MDKIMKLIYEIIMITLVLLTIFTLWIESAYNTTINWVVWGIFFVDFLIRLFVAKNKWQFIKSNPFLLIAIIPFDQFFQMARIVRLLYFYRIKTIAKYYITPYIKLLTNRSKLFFLGLFIMLLLGKSVLIWQLETSVTTFYEAVIVVFGHLLFFGHRIFIIEHALSISFLTVTSILGVVLQGIALQWFLSKLEYVYQRWKYHQQNREVG